jgi:hypothetical protein
VCAHSFLFVSSLIELIAGRSEHANETGNKKKKEQVMKKLEVSLVFYLFVVRLRIKNN